MKRGCVHRLAMLILMMSVLTVLRADALAGQSAGVQGTVVDESGGAVEAAAVRLTAAEGRRFETTAGRDGRFAVTDVPPGPVTLDVSKHPFAPTRLSLTVPAASSRDVTVVLRVAGLSERVDIGAPRTPASAGTATKTDALILETAQSIQVVTGAQLQDRRPTKLTDALGSVSGVSDGGSRRAFDFPYLRGFDASSDVFLDGLRVERGQANLAHEVIGLEQIDVVKGPSAMLFGQGALGGVINEVSRRPTRTPHAMFEGTAGAYGFYQGRVELNGPTSATTSARIDAIVRTEKDFVDRIGKSRVHVAPALRWAPREGSEFTLRGTFTRDRGDGSYVGLPAEGTVLPNVNGGIPRRRNIREPDWDRLDVDRAQIGYLLAHRLSDRVRLRQNLRYTDSDVLSRLTLALALFPDERTLLRGLGQFTLQDRSLAVDTQILANGRTGPFEHVLLAGLDVFEQRVRQSFSFGLHAPLDLFEPKYGLPIEPLFPAGQDFGRRDRLVGVYVQDQVRVSERVRIVAGGRYDRSNTSNHDRITDARQAQPSSSFVPRLGGTIALSPLATVYGAYARSFNPTFGTTFAGSPFRPERGRLYEAGLKTSLADGRLTSTFALFTITRSNVLATDPNPAHAGFQVQTGLQRSRGLEVDVASRLSRDWTVDLAYAATDARIVHDTDAEGSRPQNVPTHQLSVFTRYDVPQCRGLSVGGGLRTAGSREGTIPNTYVLPRYTSVDGLATYRWRRLLVQLNASNLFDVDYVASAASIGGIGVLIGERRTLRGTLGVTF